MSEGQPLVIFFGLGLAGLVGILLVWVFAYLVVPKIKPAQQHMTSTLTNDQLSGHGDAVLMVEFGGRVKEINPAARQWFSLMEGEFPNLERLARRVRPSEEFLRLCAEEGEARFSINGRIAEGSSYRVPGDEPGILLTVRRVETSPAFISDDRNVSSSVLRIVTEFSQAIASDLNLDKTVSAILENVERLVPSDFVELKLWHEDTKSLLSYRFTGISGIDRELEKGGQSRFGEYTNYIVHEHDQLFIPDTRNFNKVAYAIDSNQPAPVRSYLGIPLIVGGELIGTLEVGVIAVDSFAAEDQSLLGLIAGQAAIALHNAVLYETQQKRSAELLGLANLAHATTGPLRESQDLYERLVSGLSVLFDVEIIGILLYDENRRMLLGQVPFQGLPPNVVQVYKTTVPVGGSLDQYLSEHEPVFSVNAADDPRWVEMGLESVSQAASLRDTVYMPLASGGRALGFIQLSNHRNGQSSFSDNEMRLLNIVSDQISTLIENVLLVQQSRQRAQRSEALRQIASMANSTATLDEVLRFSAQELARLLQADVGMVFLYDDNLGRLSVHSSSVVGVSEDQLDSLSEIYVDPAQFRLSATGNKRFLLSGRLSEDIRVPSLYQKFVEKLDIVSAIIVPLIVRDQGAGEILIASRQRDFFNNYDLQVMATAVSQLSSAVERSQTANYTDENLLRRVEYLNAISRVVRVFNTTTDIKSLVESVYDESVRIAGSDCGSIIFFDDDIKTHPDAGITYFAGHQPTDGLMALESDTLDNGEPIIVDDFDGSKYNSPHADIYSSLCVPVMYQGQVSGLIHLHSHLRNGFSVEVSEVIQTLSVQAAISFGNALRLHEHALRNELLRRRAETLSKLFATSQQLRVDQPLEVALDTIAKGVQEATPFDIALFSIYEPSTGMLHRVVGRGLSDEVFAQLKSHQQLWKSISDFFKPEFQIGQAYLIPFDQVPVVPADVHLMTVVSNQETQLPNGWNAEDLLLMPLQDSSGNPLGLLSLDGPRDGLRPDRTTIETLEVFAAQAVLAISSIHQAGSLREQVNELSGELTRQKDMLVVSQSHLPMLLHKDIYQTIAVNNLEKRSRRVRAGLEITEAISRQLDSSSALLSLGREVLTHFDMNTAIVAEDTSEGPRISHVLGSIPRGVNPEAMFGQRNPLRTCLQTGEAILSFNLEEDEAWHDTPLLTAMHAKSFICLPVIIDRKPVAAVMSVSFEPMFSATEDDRQVYFQIARQISIILQNINLLSETRKRLQEVNLLLDFSRQISGLDPTSIVKALLDSALRVITAAHAGTAFLWDDNENLLVPRSAANYADNESMLGISYHPGEGLVGRVFNDRQARRVDEINFAADYNLVADNLLKYRKATSGRLPVSCLLVSIQTSESNLGILVLDNFNTVAGFSAQDEALLLSLTQQVALSLENVRLVQATEDRARQLQALNDVAATISSSLRRDQLVAELLERLEGVIPYDTSILWLRKDTRMVVAAARGFDDNEQRQGLSVVVEDSALLREMTTTGRGISIGDVREDVRFPSLIETRYLSWLGIPLITKGAVIGVIALEKIEPNYYGPDIVQLATTFASQAAVALENASLYEESVSRAVELDQRSQRLALLNKFSAELSGALNADQIMRLTAQQLRQALGAVRASVVLFEQNGRTVLQNVLPDELNRPIIYRALPAVPLFEHMRESLGIFTSDDVSQEAGLFPIMDLLAGTCSLMVLPVGSNENLQAVFVQTAELHHFTPSEIDLARTFSNQAAIALQNAHLYQSTLLTAERLATLNEASYAVGASLNPEDIYRAIHNAVEKLMPTDAFVLAMLDETSNEIEGTYIVDMGQRITGMRVPYGQGVSGRVIASGEPLLTLDSTEDRAHGTGSLGEKGVPHSIAAVPIFSAGRPVGMLSAQSYQYNAYSQDDIQILSTLANQTSVAIQNSRLFAETQNLAETLELRVIERTGELQKEQRNTETLLRILTEVSASLDLDRALSKTLALLNEAIGAEQGTVMLLNPDDNLLHFRAGYGYATAAYTESNNPLMLKVGEGLAGWVVKNRQPTLVDDLLTDPRWVVAPNTALMHRSAIVAPLVVGEVVSGAIMVYHRQVGYFSEDSLEMVQAIGSQVAISINNAQLYELIRDQAERLGSMLRDQAVESSRQTAILEAVADGVLVTDSRNHITFLNQSAERILKLEGGNIMGQPIEKFSGLFGKATQAWSQTIRNWSDNPSEHHAGDTYAEQITLEDGRVALVHLAPVIWKREFLGTVSIFRDITHEVEVDRLKSEFVATVSHELRTPMTSIRGYVDIMLMGAAGAMTDNQKHFLQIVKNNTERLNVLVNDLLDISRIEAGRVTLSFQALDLNEIAQEVIAGVLRHSQEEEKPMAISINCPDDLPRVLGDLERVRQILSNLVDNAYHYTPHNGQIGVRMRQMGDYVQVDIEDNGIGISLDAQDRIFERFYRGEDALVLATPGTGLGLSIVKQLVEMHNGKIWMYSTGMPGQGSMFSFTLPVYQAEE